MRLLMYFKRLLQLLLFGLFLIVALWDCRANAGQDIVTTLEAYAAARDSLWRIIEIASREVLPELVKTDEIARELGFASIKDVIPEFHEKARASNVPFLVFDVNSETLRNPAMNALDVPYFANQIMFPLTVNGETKSSITVRIADPKRGRVTRWGSRKLIVELVKRRSEHAGKQSFLVRVPSLNRNYLGFIDGPPASRRLRLVQLFRDQYFKAGETLPAAQVFARLSAEANRMSDAPR
jgi:hypothetical protein